MSEQEKETLGKVEQAAGAALQRMRAEFTGLKVVEVGCGAGENLARLDAIDASELVGVEVNERLLRNAKRWHYRTPHVSLIRHGLNGSLPLSSDYFDAVLLTLVFRGLESSQALLFEASRIVRPEGRIIVTEQHPLFRPQGEGSASWGHVRPAQEIERTAHAQGLRVVSSEDWRDDADVSPSEPALYTLELSKSSA